LTDILIFQRSHMLVHSTERPYSCDLCHLKFKCPKQLACHKRTHFPRNLKVECSVCGKKFLTKSKLTRHYRIHVDEYQFTW
jgi:KRAB domain-containing zinc finger protein